MRGQSSRRRFVYVSMYVLLCVIWGSTWMVIKIGYGGLGPFTVAALRFLIAGMVCVPLVPLFGARWPRGAQEWMLVVFLGVLLFGADYGLIYWGEQFLESGLTAILFATLPLMTVIVAHIYLPGDRITPRKLTGTLLAFLGVVVLFGDTVRIDPSKMAPMFAIVAAAGFASVTAVATKRHGTALHPAALNAPAMLVGAVALLGASWVMGERFRLPGEAATWAAIGYLAMAGSVVNFLIYFTLLKQWSVTSLSFISVFTPAIALLLGFVFLGERPTLFAGVGALLILGGVMLALMGQRVRSQLEVRSERA